MNRLEKVHILRRLIPSEGLPADRVFLRLGALDRVLGGGLARGGLHEIHSQDWTAGGFAACLAMAAARSSLPGAPLFWVRSDYEGWEYGGLDPQGLAELGGNPGALFLIRTANAAEALAASADILACPQAGALLLEISGNPKMLDLTASRRLNFLAAASGVTAILLKEAAQILPSAAETRWQVSSAPSHIASDAMEWGHPSFHARLVRNRRGVTGQWHLTWDPEDGLFREGETRTAQVSGPVAAAASHRPAAEKRRLAL